MIPFFKLATKEYIDQLLAKRPGEVKLGERIQLPAGEDLEDILKHTISKFVLLGIPEDIGVRANGGVGGAHTAWEPALKSLLNIQSTDILSGKNLLVLGAFDFSEWMKESEKAYLPALREIVSRIDEAVYPIIQAIIAAGKIPVVVGGGHNNAYPILKGASMAYGDSVNCINLDAHSDYRVIEGRHSGNGFRYAKADGYLSRYAMVGLHRNYNSNLVLNDLTEDADLHHSFYEDIFLRQEQTFQEAIAAALAHTKGLPTGIELDLDCIEHTLSSAATPCGITALQARQYIYQCASSARVAYLHITEGAIALRDGRHDNSTAKLIAYLISDFLRSYQ